MSHGANAHKRKWYYAILSAILVGLIFTSAILGGFAPKQLSYAEIDPENPSADKLDKSHAPGILLVKFKKDVSKTQQEKILKANSAKLIDEVSNIGVKIIKIPNEKFNTVESALKKNKSVLYVERDYLLPPLEIVPTDTYFSKQWHHSKLQSANAWDISKGDQVTIAILDTGVDSSHPDLADKLLSTAGYNFYNNNNDWSDVCGHGTAVAGSAAATTNNDRGVAGIAWNSKILPIRVTDPACNGYYSAMTKGIVYAADHGARVANISFRIFDGSAITDAAKYMYNKGGWVVAAGGNTGVYENYKDNPYIISVSASDLSDNAASFSSYGPYIDFAAPGSSIYTTVKGGTYGAKSGTSFSSPIVAGAVALLFSYNPSYSSQEVYDQLKLSSVDLGNAGFDEHYGWGRINLYSALSNGSTDSNTGTSNDTPNTVNNPDTPDTSNDPDPIIDTTPPQLTIDSPISEATLKGTVKISGSATDDGGSIAKIEITVDGKVIQTMTTSTYSYSWNTKNTKDGPHTIIVTAYDSGGNSASDSVVVMIKNKPR